MDARRHPPAREKRRRADQAFWLPCKFKPALSRPQPMPFRQSVQLLWQNIRNSMDASFAIALRTERYRHPWRNNPIIAHRHTLCAKPDWVYAFARYSHMSKLGAPLIISFNSDNQTSSLAAFFAILPFASTDAFFVSAALPPLMASTETGIVCQRQEVSCLT